MPDKRKNLPRMASTATGAVNTDLSRNQPQADPRFLADAGGGETLPSGLEVSGPSTAAKVGVPRQDLSKQIPTYPQREPTLVVTGGKRR